MICSRGSHKRHNITVHAACAPVTGFSCASSVHSQPLRCPPAALSHSSFAAKSAGSVQSHISVPRSNIEQAPLPKVFDKLATKVEDLVQRLGHEVDEGAQAVRATQHQCRDEAHHHNHRDCGQRNKQVNKHNHSDYEQRNKQAHHPDETDKLYKTLREEQAMVVEWTRPAGRPEALSPGNADVATQGASAPLRTVVERKLIPPLSHHKTEGADRRP